MLKFIYSPSIATLKLTVLMKNPVGSTYRYLNAANTFKQAYIISNFQFALSTFGMTVRLT